jgi:hypothetical protein
MARGYGGSVGTFLRFHHFLHEALGSRDAVRANWIQRVPEGRKTMPILLWLLGIPIPLIILYLFLR